MGYPNGVKVSSIDTPRFPYDSHTMPRDLITSHLLEDARIRASVLAMRRVFRSDAYQIHLCIYSGLMGSKTSGDDLVVCLVTFLNEDTRVMFKLWTDEIRGDRNRYIETAVARLKREGQGPLHLVRDAKKWSHLPLTAGDKKALGE
jgi:hypothetical protein